MQELTEAEKVAKIARFEFDKPPIACRTVAWSDQCVYELGHEGPHWPIWADGVLMSWDGDEPWSHDFSSLVRS